VKPRARKVASPPLIAKATVAEMSVVVSKGCAIFLMNV